MLPGHINQLQVAFVQIPHGRHKSNDFAFTFPALGRGPDLGFFVDMNKLDNRKSEEFYGLFLLADDPYYDKVEALTYLDAGKWLTLYVRGDHETAQNNYFKLLKHAEKNNIQLDNFAIERTIIDHYISSDPNLYITEIQIPILD